MKRQLRLFFTALMFYTRIPCPAWAGHGEGALNDATVYFPVIGWIVGAIAAVVYAGACAVFTPELAIALSMIATILATGAFHEDGFADVCDGFGGGWTKLKILDIMKDSRVGAYGAMGIVLMLGVKYLSLVALPPHEIITIMIIAHALSRTTAATFIYTHSYVRENDDAKAKPMAKGITLGQLLAIVVLGMAPLVLSPHLLGAAVIVVLAAVHFLLGRWFVKWIGGYTGDCLGAVQQIAEVTVYLFFLALRKM